MSWFLGLFMLEVIEDNGDDVELSRRLKCGWLGVR